ncbi:hypothetical protein AB0J63_16705 [Streptosporangium canum]|uniref:hypothetical protein n=1 Tax=Streptosporangium canum TaxID=324952 RepID=UPI003434F6A1
MSDQNERQQVARIYEELSDEAKQLVVAVLSLEKENLHMADNPNLTRTVSDQIVRKVQGIVK